MREQRAGHLRVQLLLRLRRRSATSASVDDRDREMVTLAEACGEHRA
jgi:hypothetical protein